MRKWIGILAVVAIVVTTNIPIIPNAMPVNDAKTGHASQSGKKHDCHNSKEQAAEQSANNTSKTSDKCCDKGICKCAGGTCLSLSKFFGDGNVSVSAVSSGSGRITGSDESGDSAFLSRLKRPPRS